MTLARMAGVREDEEGGAVVWDVLETEGGGAEEGGGCQLMVSL